MNARRSDFSIPNTATALLFAGLCWLIAGGCNGPPLHPGVAATHPAAPGVVHAKPAGELSDEPPALYHQVKSGEKLSSIAALYGQTEQKLLHANGLDAVDGVKPGQLLFIPRPP